MFVTCVLEGYMQCLLVCECKECSSAHRCVPLACSKQITKKRKMPTDLKLKSCILCATLMNVQWYVLLFTESLYRHSSMHSSVWVSWTCFQDRLLTFTGQRCSNCAIVSFGSFFFLYLESTVPVALCKKWKPQIVSVCHTKLTFLVECMPMHAANRGNTHVKHVHVWSLKHPLWNKQC